MFSMGEMIILAVIALIFIGPKELPEVARMIGKFLAEIKNTAGEFTSAVMNARDETQKNLVNQVNETEVPKTEVQASNAEEPKTAQEVKSGHDQG